MSIGQVFATLALQWTHLEPFWQSPPSPPSSLSSSLPPLPLQDPLNPIRYGPGFFKFTSDSDAKPMLEQSLPQQKTKIRSKAQSLQTVAKSKVHVWCWSLSNQRRARFSSPAPLHPPPFLLLLPHGFLKLPPGEITGYKLTWIFPCKITAFWKAICLWHKSHQWFSAFGFFKNVKFFKTNRVQN